MRSAHVLTALAIVASGSLFVNCSGSNGQDGAAGTPGDRGDPGGKGDPGNPGDKGDPGAAGEAGTNGTNGEAGANGTNGKNAPDPRFPRSSLVALSFVDDLGTGATNFAELVKKRVEQYGNATLPAGVQFPLAHATTDSVRTLAGINTNVVASWLDPMKWDASASGARFGANADYTAYFGDGWNASGNAPQWNGSGDAAWMWINHEYVSNAAPTSATAPKGQAAFLADNMAAWGMLSGDPRSNAWSDGDLVKYINQEKKELGGSWVHIVRDAASGEWHLDRGAANLRYDATSNTLTKLTGASLSGTEKDDKGVALPSDVIPGIMGNCSGGQTPWGTVITAEENVQDYYGDFESCWDSDQKFVTGAGFDPGKAIAYTFTPSTSAAFGRSSDTNARHARDGYGWLVEIDPGKAASEYYGKTTAGDGHKKLGAMGRARWENATFVTDGSWKLNPGKPITMYAGDDRRGGRMFKWVSKDNYTAGMTRAQTRALLDEGSLYVAHFAGLDNLTGDTLVGGATPTETAPGTGKWIKISLDSTDIAPNAAALGTATKTVGEALKDNSWNGIGGFTTDLDVRRALFTACAKIGVMELNRPEDLEWNPKDSSGTPRLYVAFTNHGRKTALDQDGKLFDPAKHTTDSKVRNDKVGSIFAIEDGTSGSFKYFRVWKGTDKGDTFGTANPDNIMIDKDGGVWFGTDGAFGTAKTADGLYYLDLDPAHKTVSKPTYGLAFRVAAGPSDSEATGPSFSSDMRTIFFSVQHPGEDSYSSWPGR